MKIRISIVPSVDVSFPRPDNRTVTFFLEHISVVNCLTQISVRRTPWDTICVWEHRKFIYFLTDAKDPLNMSDRKYTYIYRQIDKIFFCTSQIGRSHSISHCHVPQKVSPSGRRLQALSPLGSSEEGISVLLKAFLLMLSTAECPADLAGLLAQLNGCKPSESTIHRHVGHRGRAHMMEQASIRMRKGFDSTMVPI